MHSLSLLRIDYCGIVLLLFKPVRARLCVVFMCLSCSAIRYNMCVYSIHNDGFEDFLFFFFLFDIFAWLSFARSDFQRIFLYFSSSVLFACLRIVIIQRNYKFFVHQCVFFVCVVCVYIFRIRKIPVIFIVSKNISKRKITFIHTIFFFYL